VCDLTSDGFQVTDAGKPQTIVFFHHNDIKLRQQASGPNEYCVDYRRRAGGPWSDSLQYRGISGLHAAAPAIEQGVGTVEDLNLTGAPSDAFQDGIDFPGDKKVGDQADRFRVVVFDRGSDTIGSLTIRVGAPGQSRL